MTEDPMTGSTGKNPSINASDVTTEIPAEETTTQYINR